MFKFKCPQCGSEIEAQDEWEGQRAECPFCQAKITISRPRRHPSVSIGAQPKPPPPIVSAQPKPPLPTRGAAQPKATKQAKAADGGDDYCFWLGFFYWFFGLLIAAIIEGKDGVKEARKGMRVAVLVLVVLFALGSLILHAVK